MCSIVFDLIDYNTTTPTTTWRERLHNFREEVVDFFADLWGSLFGPTLDS